MNFEIVNFQTSDSETASQRRWQQVLDFGCSAEDCWPHAVWQTGVPNRPAFEVIP